jgi:hypothetical protein
MLDGKGGSMASETVSYLKLTPTKDNRLSLNDSKKLISCLGSLSKDFKLIVKSQTTTGIELYIAIDESSKASVKKHIYAINPGIIVEEDKEKTALIKPNLSISYKFKHHFAYPLAAEDNQADILTLMGHVAQLANNQSLELVLSAKPTRSVKGQMLSRGLLNGRTPKLYDPDLKGRLETLLFGLMSGLVLIIRLSLKTLENLIYSNNQKPRAKFKPRKIADSRSVAVLDKLYDPLFKSQLSLNIKASSLSSAYKLAKDVSLGLNNFALSAGYQQYLLSDKPHWDTYSLSDLAAIFHIPKMSNIYSTQEFKTLAPPPELLRTKQKDGVVLGLNTYQGSSNKLILNNQARARHVYITGATGSGKSTLMANLMLQDIKAGHGLSLIDPHGDLAEQLMSQIPKERQADLIYFDPTDAKSSITLNPLELTSTPGTVEYIAEKDQLTENLISLFRKVFDSEDISSHRIEYILRNSIHTALLIESSNIFTIFQLLTDTDYRQKVVPRIKDKNLANFWRNELGKAGEYQRVKMTAGITARVGRFLFSGPAKRVFSAPHSSLDFDHLMNDRKILICNFAKGRLGEDGSKLFATTVLTKLQLSALKRVNLAASNRADHYLYIDEFQNYSPSNLIQILSESRKYGLYLTMAEQSPSQQDAYSTSVILANVANLICFRTASPKDERLLLPNFTNYLTAEDLNNLPAYNFYFKSVSQVVIPPTSGKTIARS